MDLFLTECYVKVYAVVIGGLLPNLTRCFLRMASRHTSTEYGYEGNQHRSAQAAAGPRWQLCTLPQPLCKIAVWCVTERQVTLSLARNNCPVGHVCIIRDIYY
jgi:hypothetical protein